MKKILYTLIFAALSVFISSCEKTAIGGTATQDMAGDWYVVADLCDANGNVVAEDPYGVGQWHSFTYNTAANVGTEMYVSDGKEADSWNFWQYAIKVNINPDNMTFSAENVENEAYDGCQITIIGGKITINGATTPSGTAADAIEYIIHFSDDDPNYYYKIHGYRYTGLVNDD